jgi:putative transposase
LFTLSLVSVQARRAFPLRVEQVVRSDAEKAASKAKAAAKQSKAPCAKRRPGRPKGQPFQHRHCWTSCQNVDT